MSSFMIGVLLFVLFVLLTIFCMQMYSLLSSNAKMVNNFPGPKVLPVIGNLFDIWTDEATIFKKLREFAKLYYPSYKLWSTSVFCAINIIAPEDMQVVLSNVKHNEKSDIYMLFNEWLGEGLLTSGGEKWQQRRKVLTPTFHFKILKQFIGIFNKHSNQFAEDLAPVTNQTIEILPHIHKCSLHTIAETAMGTTMSDPVREKKYRNAIHRMGDIMVHRVLRPWFYFRLTNLFNMNFYPERYILWYLKNFTKRVIDEREKKVKLNPNLTLNDNVDEDGVKKNHLAMLDLLILAKNRKEIDYNGVREEVDTFMFEGHDTIAMAMQFCYMLLANNKDIQDKVYEEISSILSKDKKDPSYEDLNNLTYTEMVIKESLRLYPSVPLISRVAGEDIKTLSGQVIPKGVILILHIFDTHHNPDVYPDPEKFDPERFLPENVRNRNPYAYLPFSAGSRNCIGQKYAMLNMKSMLALTLFEYELLPVDTPKTITLIADIILRTKNPIRLKFRPRNTA